MLEGWLGKVWSVFLSERLDIFHTASVSTEKK